MRTPLLLSTLLVLAPGIALAGSGYHPFAPRRDGVRTIDLSAEARARGAEGTVAAPYPAQPSFDDLDRLAAQAQATAAAPPSGDLTPQGSVVVPAPIAAGELVDPAVMHAVEDIPGNEYPRKHTVYLNFLGGMLYSGSDNSAESRSTLARQGVYPAYTGGEAKAIAAAQETANDVSQFGINVVYLERPPKILPYTMVMVGGSWTDTNLESSAGGVAPGTDCGALGQRHVVYTFASAGWSATAIANVNSQEAGHAWGLDHSLNCDSVMSYCGSGNGIFSSTCDSLCEAACQGAAGCRLFHEDFCGVGNDQQNEADELTYLFGGNEPDLEAPFVEIVSPEDGLMVEEGGSVQLRAVVDDDYGGYGWRFVIEHQGEVIYDQVDYDKQVDDQYRPAINLVGLEPGTYSITVEVADHFEHVSTDTVTFTVAGDPGEGLDESGGGEGSGGGTGGPGGTGKGEGDDDPFGSGGTAADEGGSGSGDPGADAEDEGCACRASSGPGGGLGGALLGLLALLRTRRNSRNDRPFGRASS